MKSPEACTHSIKIESNGKLIYRIEFPEDNKNKRFYKFDTIVHKDIFIKLERLSANIESNEEKASDAFYYILLKNDVKIGESSARKSQKMNDVKDYLVDILPFKVDYFCTKFITGEYGYNVNGSIPN